MPELSNNTLVLNRRASYFPGDIATFSCTTGHRLFTTHDSVTCQDDGTWDKSVPTCDPQTCTAPPNITNGSYRDRRLEYAVGQALKYECRYGYEFKSDSINPTGTVSCLPSGQWEAKIPVCSVVTCPPPPRTTNGRVTYDSLEFTSVARYQCNDGYSIQDYYSELECIEDGTWDNEPPVCEPVDCGVPDTLMNGIGRAEQTTFGSVASYQCNTGYTLVGTSTRTCQADTTWGGDVPVCNPISCGIPPSVTDGSYVGNELTFDQTITYVCNDGFILAGARDSTCRANGQWSGQPPTCVRRECNVPPSISNGFFQEGGYVFGDNLRYDCTIGYEMAGNDTIECIASGDWSTPVPNCVPVRCDDIGSIDNGNFTITSNTFGGMVIFVCDEGYEMEGESIRICQPDGRWSSTQPTCVAGKCEAPPLIDNGKIDYKDLSYKSVVIYTCDTGYTLVGKDVRRCLQNLTLDDEEPTCVPKSCTDPGDISHGTRILNGLVYNSIVTFQCDTGYRLEGQAQLTCSASGEWSGFLPFCEIIECETPARVTSNGRMIGDEFTYGATISYECDEGYNLVGTQNRTCQANGEWDTKIPICEIVKCPRQTINNGFSSSFQREFGTTLTFTCRYGYTLVGSAERRCLSNGTWSGPEPVCLPVDCGIPDPLINGVARAEQSTFGSVVTYLCDNGYTLEGNNARTCQADTSWDGDVPLCNPVSCGTPPTLTDGSYIGNELTFDQTITYTCNEGFILAGVRELTCTANGQWSGQPPTCIRRECSVPPSISNGFYQEGGYVFGDRLKYDCNFGYEMAENDTIECIASGDWSTPIPNCVPVPCGNIESIDNGNFTITSNTFGGMVTFFCDEGYEMQGESVRVCQPDGHWSSTQPTCVAGKCEAPPLIENGKIDYKDLSYKSVVIYTCDTGYRLVGKDVRRCLQNLTLSDEEPMCVPKSCTDPGDIPHGTRILNGLVYNSVLTYQCDIGYRLEGQAQLTCSASGEWSGFLPFCEIIECETPARIISNGRMIGNDFSYGAIISYECNEGYNLVGSNNRTCQEDGQWDIETPICEIVKYPIPTISNGSPSGFQRDFGTTLTFTCNFGYALFGSSERRCLSNGTWSGPDPVCVECQMLIPIDHGTLTLRDSKVAVYQCNPNFFLRGNSQLECQRNGSWNGSPPQCLPESCDTSELEVDSFIFGSVNVSGSALDDTVEYKCEKGFELLGESTRRCSLDGHWSGITPICTIVTCPGSFNIINGRILGTSYTYNSNLTFECSVGFRIVGNEYVTCQEDGNWSGDAPICHEITCPTLTNLLNGQIRVQSYSHGSEAIYSCNTGYEIRELDKTQAKRTCGLTGEWNGTDYICEVIECPHPQIQNGWIKGSEYTIGKRIEYFCDEGYRLSGIPLRICFYTKVWSGPDPECIPIECTVPPPLENGVVLDNGRTTFYYGDLVQYRCNDGYFLLGDSDRTCQATSSWSGVLPMCSRVSCSGLPVVENSETRLLNGTISFGDKAIIECHEGYTLSSSNRISVCNSDGFWSQVDVQCLKVTCPPLPEVQNGQFSSNNVEYGSVVTITCDKGYRVNGVSAFQCQANATWNTANLPSCNIVMCSEPENISNGIREYGGLTYGSEVVYRCARGYELVGSMNRSCNASGLWSGSKPFCKEILCQAPPSTAYGRVSSIGTRYAPGDVVRYVCDRGYVIAANDSLTCSNSGEWSGPLPRCSKIVCARPVSPRNGRVNYNEVSFGSNISFACNSGFEIRGSAISQCLETGLWNTDAPSCVPVNCGSPAYVTHAYVIGDSYIFGSVVTYLCEEGYELDGNENIVCREDAQWSNDPPVCNPISCGLPPVIDHAVRTGDGFTYREMVFYSCEKGYELSGNNLLECEADGEWIGNPPSCEPVTCGPPPVLMFATTLVMKKTYGSSATYICNDGYTLQGDMMTKCSENGSWIKDPSVACVPVQCGNPPLILNGKIQYNTTTFQSNATYMCNPGYNLTGNNIIRCSANGLWAGGLPTCSKNRCDPPLISNDVLVIGNMFGIGDSVEFRCPDRHILIGEARSRCTSIGTWSSRTPDCQCEYNLLQFSVYSTFSICIYVTAAVNPKTSYFIVDLSDQFLKNEKKLCRCSVECGLVFLFYCAAVNKP